MAKIAPLDAEERAVWHALKQLSDTAIGAVGRAIETETGLSGAEYGILSRLEDLGGGTMTQRALAESLGWHKARLSHQLTRMEARDLLQRDGTAASRAVCIRILGPGRKAIQAARPIHAASVRAHLLRHLGPGERALLLALHARLTD